MAQKHVTIAADDNPDMMELYRAITSQVWACPECLQEDIHALNLSHGNEVGDADQMVARVSVTCANCETVVHCEMPHWLWWSDQSLLKGNVHDTEFRILSGESIASAFKRTAGYEINGPRYSAPLR